MSQLKLSQNTHGQIELTRIDWKVDYKKLNGVTINELFNKV